MSHSSCEQETKKARFVSTPICSFYLSSLLARDLSLSINLATILIKLKTLQKLIFINIKLITSWLNIVHSTINIIFEKATSSKQFNFVHKYTYKPTLQVLYDKARTNAILITTHCVHWHIKLPTKINPNGATVFNQGGINFIIALRLDPWIRDIMY
mgnify:CR=1 FL=1